MRLVTGGSDHPARFLRQWRRRVAGLGLLSSGGRPLIFCCERSADVGGKLPPGPRPREVPRCVTRTLVCFSSTSKERLPQPWCDEGCDRQQRPAPCLFRTITTIKTRNIEICVLFPGWGLPNSQFLQWSLRTSEVGSYLWMSDPSLKKWWIVFNYKKEIKNNKKREKKRKRKRV